MSFFYKLFCLLFIVTSVSSCQILSWYKLKRQLKNVPKYFSVERSYNDGESNDFIIMKEPILKKNNIFFLTKKKPTKIIHKGEKTIEVFSCIREKYPQYSFSVNVYYNKDGYMYRLDPPNILTNSYDDYTYNRIGNELLKGDINILDYEIKAIYKRDSPKFNILDRMQIKKRLGEPDENSTNQIYIYSYKVDTVTKAKKGVYLDVAFKFNFDANGIIKYIHFNFATVNLYFYYSD